MADKLVQQTPTTISRPPNLPLHVFTREEIAARVSFNMEECDDGDLSGCPLEALIGIKGQWIQDAQYPNILHFATVNWSPKPGDGESRRYYPTNLNYEVKLAGKRYQVRASVQLDARLVEEPTVIDASTGANTADNSES